MATTNKKPSKKIAEPMTPETRAEKINKLVEEQASIVDAQEEKFLESTVAEIETQPVVEEFVEDVPPMGEPDMTPIINEPMVEVPTVENKWEKSGLLEGLTGNVNEEAAKLFESPVSVIINEPVVVDPITGNINVKFEFQDEYHFGPGNGDAEIDVLPKQDCTCEGPCEEPCVCDEKPCVCEKPEEIKEVLEKYHNIDAEAEISKLLEAETPKFQLGQQIQKLAEVDIEPTTPAPVTTPPVKKTFAQMTATEMNIYKKTGIIPFV